jgi:hypothetical protein
MYALAALLLIASILLGLSVGSASAAIPAATIGFQSPALKPVWDALVSGLQFLGMLVFSGGLLLALLISSIGLLVGRIANLECRISRLERMANTDSDHESDTCHQSPLVSAARIGQTQ